MQLCVTAIWDSEAKVWVATSEDIPGLVTEADTAEELEEKLKVMIPEMLFENGIMEKCEEPQIPFRLHTERDDELFAPCVQC
jgi:predicted RNase H-like HicB family nuclease